MSSAQVTELRADVGIALYRLLHSACFAGLDYEWQTMHDSVDVHAIGEGEGERKKTRKRATHI